MERVYVIPLRKAFKKSRKKRADAAISLMKDFLKRHTKSDEVRIGKNLNELIWSRGREKIPRRVKVKVFTETLEGKIIAKAELIGFEYKSLKVQAPKVKEETKQKIEERVGQKALEKQKEDKLIEGKVEAPTTKEEEKDESNASKEEPVPSSAEQEAVHDDADKSGESEKATNEENKK